MLEFESHVLTVEFSSLFANDHKLNRVVRAPGRVLKRASMRTDEVKNDWYI